MCLRSQSAKLYRAGFRGPIARSTLADANEMRDSRIFEEFALHLISIARPLYSNERLAMELQQTVYAIDASNVDLCLSLFAWTPSAKGRAGIKLHPCWICAATFQLRSHHSAHRVGCQAS